ncbi:otefin [Drosophila mojavensis]|uniref:LEM domain-containing protein n=1 Tax=Drosophila mojavensis TaxID=7230 RepID=B4KM70_DROMO|nr:otefin [Drosophila mojavensis]EDW08734.1 uncharacterized protein Dmoj_GI19394 [Drosophila mojavensis]
MAETDNLDNLSNAELRARMLAQGLPNIPVTDSSRKVLVKRLRASLGGNAALPAGSPKKSNARRETLQPAAVAAASTTAGQVDKPDGAPVASKARRTIAVNPSDTKEDERRRQQQQQPVSKPQAVPEAVTVVKPVPVKAAPIQSRRISNSERREPPKERIARKPEPIAEEPTVPANQRESDEPLLVNSLIILESDDEEEEQLAQAAQDAEDQYSEHNRQIGSKPKPRSKLMATTVNTHEYVAKPLYPSLQPNPLEQQRLKQVYEDAPSPTQPRATLGATSSINSYDYRPATGRYSNYVSSPAQSYTSASSSAFGYSSSSLRRSPPRTYSNEFSDDAAEEDGQGVKFESDFARNLARLRAERIGERGSSYRRSVPASSIITGGRRSLRQGQDSSLNALARLWQTLDNKYKLKSKLFILIVLLVLFAVYRFYY